MSFNQSRSDKSDNIQYRKTPRSANSNQHRNSSGGFGRGGSGGGVAPALSQSNRSFKKTPVVNSAESSSAVNAQSGAHVQSQLSGQSDALLASSAAKPTESVANKRSTRAVTTPQPATMSSDTTMPTTPEKTPGDASKAFPFQFGSISPGFMNGMQIPARTSSAPPNLDEQKRDQAHRDSIRSVPQFPVPAVPKQQLPRKDAVVLDQSKSGEAYPVPKTRKDSQVSPAPLPSQTHKPSIHPLTGMPMPINYHQPQVSVQFGGPNPQIQSQGMTAGSLQMPMPMPLPMGNASQVQQQMFVPGIQTHLMQPQGIIHQGQNLSFTTQIGPQLPSQLGNLGIGMTPQYPQQQSGKFASPRKTTVKITDPKTHEEVRFDRMDGALSGLRSHPNIPPQSQPTASFTSHPINYFPGSYNTGSLYFPGTASLPTTNNQITPNHQAPRFSYPVSQAPQNVSFMNPSIQNPVPVNKSRTSMHGIGEPATSAPSAMTQVTVKPAAGSIGEKLTNSSLSDNSVSVENDESSKPSRASGEASSSHPRTEPESFSERTLLQLKPGQESVASTSLPVRITQAPISTASADTLTPIPLFASSALLESAPVVTNTESKIHSGSNSIRDHPKKAGKKGSSHPQHQGLTPSSQVGGQSNSVVSSPSHFLAHGESGVLENAEAKTTLHPPIVNELLSGSTGQSQSMSVADTSDPSESKVESTGEATCISPETSHAKLDNSSQQDELRKYETSGEQVEIGLAEGPKLDKNSVELSSESMSSQPNKQAEQESASMSSTRSDGAEVLQSDTADNLAISTPVVDTTNVKAADTKVLTKVDISDQKLASEALDIEESVENIGGGFIAHPISDFKDKPTAELNRSKSSAAKGKKKRKEFLQKADAAGTTSDLYNAYKGPEEKKETIVSSESTESVSAGTSSKQGQAGPLEELTLANEKNDPTNTEPDDWEDAAEISTPKLEALDYGELASRNKDGDGILEKKYSRDFLLKFAEQCTVLPEGFDIDIADAVMSANVNIPIPGRSTDRTTGGSRQDRRGSNIVDDDRWNKLSGSLGSGRELRLDINYGGNASFRLVQGGNYGVLRNPRMQSPNQYAGGILSGPVQSLGSQGGMQRNSPDADRWQRATNFQQKGLIPSVQTPLQTMHKAERKYEVGKVTDEEQAKQRQLKSILNKLTPQNFEKLFEQVKAVNIDNSQTLTGVISQIFDKALMEPTFCEMYANFCFYLAGELPDFGEDNEKITFKRLLLNKCQEEFERGEREEEEANKVDEEGEVKQSEGEREEKRLQARRRMLGNIRLIGELYKKKMLTEKIMHECIQKLLGQYQNPDEEDVESLCKLMSTIGEMIDHPKAKAHMDAYFDMMSKLSNNMKLSSRVRFMLKDTIDLRRNKWQQRRKVEGPKKIEEVHRDAAQERQAQSSRLARGQNMNSSRRGPSMDFGPRGSTMLPSPNAQMGSFRGLPTQARGFGIQDVRLEDRQSIDARTLSVPLPQRPGDDSITLGPQGGLARGMSIRGPSSMLSVPLAADTPSNHGDSRRVTTGLNGYSSASERTSYSSREEHVPRLGAYDQSSVQERNINNGNLDPRNQDRSFDRSVLVSPPTRAQAQTSTPNVPSEKIWPEERLRDNSMATIKEFYSARDEKEVSLRIKELNAPSFHPSMISLWVTDSFERKDMERDLLAKLLVNLSKPTDGVLSQTHLIKGFESVLSTLEDAINDAPKAPEYIGRIFARVILEDVISLKEIGQLIHEGGEEPGSLLEVGLAADVLGTILEKINSEKGETVLNEFRSSSNLCLETFRPPNPNRSRKLDQFI